MLAEFLLSLRPSIAVVCNNIFVFHFYHILEHMVQTTLSKSKLLPIEPGRSIGKHRSLH